VAIQIAVMEYLIQKKIIAVKDAISIRDVYSIKRHILNLFGMEKCYADLLRNALKAR